MRTHGVGKKVTPKDTQNNKIIEKDCNPFLITVLNIRPWRNWITQQIPILEIGGSNPFGRAIKGLQKRYSHRKTLILSGFFLLLWAKFQLSI